MGQPDIRDGVISPTGTEGFRGSWMGRLGPSSAAFLAGWAITNIRSQRQAGDGSCSEGGWLDDLPTLNTPGLSLTLRSRTTQWGRK